MTLHSPRLPEVRAVPGVRVRARGWGWRHAGRRAWALRDVNLDIGQTVHVRAWGADGTAHVSYRGANWAASFGGEGTPAPGQHAIVAVRGNQLVLAPRAAKAP